MDLVVDADNARFLSDKSQACVAHVGWNEVADEYPVVVHQTV